MRYSCSDLALAGCGQVLPSVTLEFFGSVNWTIAFLLSINPCFGLDIGHGVGGRVCMLRVLAVFGESPPAGAPRLSVRLTPETPVTTACSIRLANSSVSIR